MGQPAIFTNMNAVECQSLIFTLEDEMEVLEYRYKKAVKHGATLLAERLALSILLMQEDIKEVEIQRDAKGV